MARIKICGVPFDVRMTQEIGDGTACGMCHAPLAHIAIDRRLPAQVKHLTLWHECMHGADWIAHLQLNHRKIWTLAHVCAELAPQIRRVADV